MRSGDASGCGTSRAYFDRPLAVVVLAAAIGLGLALGAHGPRSSLLDLFQRWWPRAADQLPVVVVAIDEPSLEAFGQWPWPRTLTADLIARLKALGPVAIGLDIVMPESDRLSPREVLARHPQARERLRALIEELPSNDSILAGTVSSRGGDDPPVVLGFAGIGAAVTTPSQPLTPVRVRGDGDTTTIPAHDALLRNVPELEGAAAGHGLLNADPDRDGVVRRMPLVGRVGDTIHPSLSTELLRVAQGARWFMVETDPGGVNAVTVGELRVATDRRGGVNLRYSASDPRRYESARAVLDGKVDPGRFEGKIVIVGVTALGLTDAPPTPVTSRMNGVEIQAQTLENVIYGLHLARPRWATWAEVGAGVLGAVVLIAAVPALQGLVGVSLALLVVGALVAASGLALVQLGLLLDATPSVAHVLATYLALVAGLLVRSERARRELRELLDAERIRSARVAGELGAARDIQRGILPRPETFELPGASTLHAYLEPANEIGGDLYDIIELDERHLLFLLGDVSGKGVPASLFMAVSKTLCKSTALRGGNGSRLDAGALLTAANVEVSRENPTLLFVTIGVVVVDLYDGTLNVGVAGHDAPLIVRPGRAPERVELGGGPPLCVIEGFVYHGARAKLERGESLVLFTDGVTEAMNADREFYGAARLEACLSLVSQADDAARIVGRIVTDLAAFTGTAPPHDDVAILVYRRGDEDRITRPGVQVAGTGG